MEFDVDINIFNSANILKCSVAVCYVTAGGSSMMACSFSTTYLIVLEPWAGYLFSLFYLFVFVIKDKVLRAGYLRQDLRNARLDTLLRSQIHKAL